MALRGLVCCCLLTAAVAADCEECDVNLMQRHYHITEPPLDNVSRSFFDTQTYTGTELQGYLSVPTPLYWLHIPKCGLTFINAMMHLPGVCTAADEDLKMTTTSDIYTNLGLTTEECPGYYMLHGHMSTHDGIDDIYSEHVEGHGMTMFRQPEQRIISGFNNNQHSWDVTVHGRQADNVSDYAGAVAGCATKMITRSGHSKAFGKSPEDGVPVCGSLEPVTPEESKLAVERLKGFAFIGLVEEWNLSICLLHTLFGGRCQDFEFEAYHTGENRTSSLYDTTELDGFIDVYDRLLYREAERLFHSRLQEYNVSYSSCEPCFQQAGLSV